MLFIVLRNKIYIFIFALLLNSYCDSPHIDVIFSLPAIYNFTLKQSILRNQNITRNYIFLTSTHIMGLKNEINLEENKCLIYYLEGN